MLQHSAFMRLFFGLIEWSGRSADFKREFNKQAAVQPVSLRQLN
jgi:hypothetical protein